MSYIVFARKFRPKDFDEIIGQEHITTTLKNAIKQNRVAHAYLFCGPRGIGKTTTARILAKSLNCQKAPSPNPCNKCSNCIEIAESRNIDVIEIDGASNRGIEEVRNIRDNVKFSPQSSRCKIYIIDEVHMLTPEAVNALLKTLEEPPSHVKFIFATTQPHKLLPTILSRCQRFDFKRIATADIINKLKTITKQEGIKIDEESLFTIAQAAEGSMRDAESILDQLNSFCDKNIDLKSTSQILGITENQALFEIAQKIIDKDTKGALAILNNLITDGKDLGQTLASLTMHIRNLLMAKLGSDELIELTVEWQERIKQQSRSLGIEDILYIFYILLNTQEQLRWSQQPRIPLEIALIKLTKRESILPISEIIDRLAKLEDRLTQGTQNEQYTTQPIQQESKQDIQKSDMIDKAIQIWPDLIRKVRDTKISAATCLAEGQPIRFDKDTLVIGFPNGRSFHKESLQANNNKKIIENALSELLKSDSKITFIDIDKEPASPQEDVSQEPQEEDKLQDTAKEPIIKTALGIFGGNIIKRPK